MNGYLAIVSLAVIEATARMYQVRKTTETARRTAEARAKARQ